MCSFRKFTGLGWLFLLSFSSVAYSVGAARLHAPATEAQDCEIQSEQAYRHCLAESFSREAWSVQNFHEICERFKQEYLTNCL